MNISRWIAAGSLTVSSLIGVGVDAATATPKTLTDAKKAGFPANNCQYCHTEAMPKKDTFKPEALNGRGKFLLDDMNKRNLKEPDPVALKNFSGTADKK
jgi:hypothetical protein